MTLEIKIDQPKAKLIPVEGRPGVYTYEEAELKVNPLTAIRGVILRELHLRSRRAKTSK